MRLLMQWWLDWYETVTPAYVVQYFRNSPTLCPLADDVEAALGSIFIPGSVQVEPQTIQDYNSLCRYVRVNGYNGLSHSGGQPNISGICRAIGVANGGAGYHRGRKLANYLKSRVRISSTTTADSDGRGQKTATVDIAA